MLCLPVELERADVAELSEGRPKDAEINIVPQIDPDHNEEGEVGSHDYGIEVVEGFGGLLQIHECGSCANGGVYCLPQGRNH